MIRHPFGTSTPVSARDFALAVVDKVFEELAEGWAGRVAPDVLADMTPQERDAAGAEMLHLLRMIQIRAGLVEHEDFSAMWEGGPDEYRLKPRYCHPGTSLKLARVAQGPDRYAILMGNAASGEFIQSLCALGLEAAMEAGAGMAYSGHWLEKVGIRHGDAAGENDHR